MDLLLGHPVGFGDLGAHPLGVLSRHPLVQTSVLPGGRGGPRLHRAGGDPLIQRVDRDHNLAVGEEVLAGVDRGSEHGRVEHGVSAGCLVEMGIGGERLPKVDHCGQWIDVDEHGLGGVGGLLVGLGDHGDHRLADPAHLVALAGEQRPRDRRVVVGWRRLETERLRGVHGDHPGHVLRLGDVDVDDHTVSNLRARVHDISGPVEKRVLEVVEIDAPLGEEARILFPQDLLSEHTASHLSLLCRSTRRRISAERSDVERRRRL